MVFSVIFYLCRKIRLMKKSYLLLICLLSIVINYSCEEELISDQEYPLIYSHDITSFGNPQVYSLVNNQIVEVSPNEAYQNVISSIGTPMDNDLPLIKQIELKGPDTLQFTANDEAINYLPMPYNKDSNKIYFEFLSEDECPYEFFFNSQESEITNSYYIGAYRDNSEFPLFPQFFNCSFATDTDLINYLVNSFQAPIDSILVIKATDKFILVD